MDVLKEIKKEHDEFKDLIKKIENSTKDKGPPWGWRKSSFPWCKKESWWGR